VIARSVVPAPATSELYGASHGVSECVAPGGDVALGAAPPLRAHPRTSSTLFWWDGGVQFTTLQETCLFFYRRCARVVRCRRTKGVEIGLASCWHRYFTRGRVSQSHLKHQCVVGGTGRIRQLPPPGGAPRTVRALRHGGASRKGPEGSADARPSSKRLSGSRKRARDTFGAAYGLISLVTSINHSLTDSSCPST